MKQNIREFFLSDYVDAASYANIRQIASAIDGLKNSSRKIVYWIQKNNLKESLKVSQLDAKIGEATQFLHGSMGNVIVNLTQDYTGTNNMPYLEGDGNFGTKIIPEASAHRYISACGSKHLFQNLKNWKDWFR